jgi:hypothetical protein
MDYKNKYIKYKNKYIQLKHDIQTGGKKNTKKIKKNNEIIKFLKEQLTKIDYIKVQLKPYLMNIDDNNDYIKAIMDKKLDKLFKKKLEKNYKKIITNGMLFMIHNIDIIKYEYDSDLDIVNVYIKPELKYILSSNSTCESFDLIQILNRYAQDIQYELEHGEQHWLDGDAVYIEKGEYNNSEYIIFAKGYSISLYYDNETKIIGYNCDITKSSLYDNNCKYFSV